MGLLQTNHRLFLTNLFSVYASSIINGCLGIVAIPVVIHALGKEQYGLYSIYMVIASYIALVDCGVTKHFVRLMASNEARAYQNDCLKKAFGWYLILCVVLLAALPGIIFLVVRVAFPVPEAYRSALQWIVVLAVVEYALAVPTFLSKSLTIANEKFLKLAKFNIVTGLVRYGLMFFAALIFKNPVILVLFLVTRRIVDTACAYFLLLWVDRSVWRPIFQWREFLDILGKSSILSLSQFLQITIVSIGSVLVNRFFGIASLGYYRAAFELSSKVWLFSNGIGMLVYPKFSKIIANSRNLKRYVEDLYVLMAKSWVLYIAIAALAICAAEFALPLIGLKDEQIVLLFSILVLGTCLNAHANMAYEFLLAGGNYRIVATISFIALILLTVLFLFLAPLAGLYAIAWAWLFSQLCFAATLDELTVFLANGQRRRTLPGFKAIIVLIALGMLFDVLFLEIWYSRYLILGSFFLAAYSYFIKEGFFAFTE